MKKAIILCVTLFALLALTGCGSGSGNSSGSDGDNSSSKNVPAINELPYTVEETMIDGERCLGATIENKSKYDIKSMWIIFKYRDDIEDMSVFDEYKTDHGFSDDDIESADLAIYCDEPILSKDKSPVLPVNIAGAVLTKKEQYDCLEPDTMEIHFKDGDKLYTVYHDCLNDKLGEPEEEGLAVEWPKTDFGKQIPVTEDAVFVSLSEYGDEEKADRFSGVDISPAGKELFDEYVQKAKDAGFTKVDYEGDDAVRLLNKDNTMFSINNFEKQGHYISIHLTEKNWNKD